MVEVLKPGRGGLSPLGGPRRALSEPPRAAVLLVCAAVLALRRAGALSNPQFWAEDGHFYERAYMMGWRCLTLPYAGYLHAVPRAVAVLAASIDPSLAPAVFVGVAALLTLYVASRAVSPRCPLPRAAGVFALAVVLVPDTYEVLLNVVNLQWVLAGGLVLLLVSRDPAGRVQWAHDLCAAVALGLTGPFSVILAPLFLWRAWEQRTRASAVLAGVVASCGLVQALCLHFQPPSDPGIPGDWGAALLVLPAVARRIGGSLLLGSLLPETSGTALGTAAGLATLLGVGFLALRPGPLRAERRMLGLAFLAILGASLLRTRWTLHEYFTPHSNSRYMFMPQLIALWLLLLTACQAGRPGRLAAALALWCLAVNAPRLREPAYADLQWARYAPAIRTGEAQRIPINPPGWILTLPARPK